MDRQDRQDYCIRFRRISMEYRVFLAWAGMPNPTRRPLLRNPARHKFLGQQFLIGPGLTDFI